MEAYKAMKGLIEAATSEYLTQPDEKMMRDIASLCL